jgi:hypothetical protein
MVETIPGELHVALDAARADRVARAGHNDARSLSGRSLSGGSLSGGSRDARGRDARWRDARRQDAASLFSV